MRGADTAEARRQGVRAARNPWWVIGTVCVGALMAALDASIVNVALPTIGRFFGVDVSATEWISIAYLITLTTLVVLFGRMSDLFGRTRMYTAGFSVFIVGSALCGASPTLAVLVGARVLQAVGAGMLQANSVAIVTAAAPPGERGRAIGVQAAFQAVGLALGPAVGGLLVSTMGWRSVFYVNVPVGIAGTLAGIMLLPRDAARHGPRLQFDSRGAVLLGAALLGFMLVLTEGYVLGFADPLVLVGGVVAVVATALLVNQEREAVDPLISPALVRLPAFTLGNLSCLLSYGVTFGTLFLLPYEFERVFHLAPAASGALLTAVPLSMMVASPFAGRLADRLGVGPLTRAGAGAFTVGAALCAAAGFIHTPLALLPGEVLVGAGMGLFTAPNNASIMSIVGPERFGITGGILNMSRSLGMSAGVAAGATLYGLLLAGTAPTSAAYVTANLTALRDAFVGLAILGLVTLLLSRGLGEGGGTLPEVPLDGV